MLRVRKCTIVMNDSNALSGGTTISMFRLKQILAKHLSELDGLTGRVHIKKLTLDLGALANVEFDKDFFDRFELVCSKFKEKLIALHSEQQADLSKDDEKKVQYIMDHLYSIEQTGSVRKLQHFIESLKRAPTLKGLKELQRAYAKQFSNSMPTEILNLLKKILGEIEMSREFSTIPEREKGLMNRSVEGGFEQKEIDYLLFLLENTRIDSSWLKQISHAFEKKYKRSIPANLLNTLKSTFDEFQWGTEPKRNSAENRYLNETEIHLLRKYLNLHSETPERNALVQLLETKNEGRGEYSWYAQLLEDYFQRFQTAMPLSLQEQLLRFNVWKKKHSWNQVDQQTRDLLQQKLRGGEVEKPLRKNQNPGTTTENEYDFILELLERTPINAAWFSQISNAFIKRFGRKLPQIIENHLLEFSTNLEKENLQDDKAIVRDFLVESNWKTALLNYLNKYPEMGVFSELIREHLSLEELDAENWQEKLEDAYYLHTRESPVRLQRIILRNFKRQQKEREFEELFSLTQKEFEAALKTINVQSKKWTVKQKNNRQKEIIQLFKGVEFSESWIADIKRVYEDYFKARMPDKVLRVLVDFANSKLDTLESARDRMSAYRKQEQISLVELRKSLQRQPASSQVDLLLEILPDANDPQKFSEIQHIISGFEVYYSKPFPTKLRKLLFAFYRESRKESTKMDQREDLVFFKATLKEQLNSTQEIVRAKAKTRPLTDEIKQLLSIMDEVQLTHRWKTELEKLYQKRFGTSISKELNDILEAFFKTLETKQENNQFSEQQQQTMDSQFASVEEWNEYLESNFEVYGVDQLRKLLSNTNENDLLSIEQMIQIFEDALEQRLPMALNALLMRFWKESKVESEFTQVKNKALLMERLQAQMIEVQADQRLEENLVQEEESAFFQSMIENFSMDASWLPRVLSEYENVFNRKIPTRLRDALFGFTQRIKKTFDEVEIDKNLQRNSRMNLERFLKQHESQNGVKELLELVTKSKGLEKSSWFSQLLQEYRGCFQKEMPINCQELLLRYSADFEWNTWKMVPAKMRNELISQVKPAIIKLSQEQNPTNENTTKGIEELGFLLSLLEVTPLNAGWLAIILKQFKLKFNKELSSPIKQLLMDFSTQLYAEIEKEFTADEISYDHFSIEMLINNVSVDLSSIEIKWIEAILSKSKKSGKQKNWLIRFFEMCSKNNHPLSETKRQRLIQFDEHWKNALSISQGQHLDKVLGVLVGNYFVKMRSSPDEREKENFTLEFIREMNNRLLVDFIAEWEKRFKKRIDPELEAILCEYVMAIHLAKKSEQVPKGFSRFDDEYMESLGTGLEENDRKENNTEKEYLLAMSQELMDGWINIKDLEMGYQHVFGKEFGEQLTAIFENLPLSEKQNSNSILTEFRTFLENSEPTKSAQDLLELLKEEIHCSSENWFEVVMKTYANRWKTTMPFSHQQLLLNFAQTRKSEPEILESLSLRQVPQRKSLVKKWENFLSSERHKWFNAENEETNPQADFIALFLETHTLDTKGFELLKKIFEAKFKCEIYPEWLSFLTEQERSVSMRKDEQLIEFGRKNLRNFKENVIVRIEEMPKCKETVELISLVQESKELTVENWFQQLLQAYFNSYANQMPIGHQAVLLEIAQEGKLFVEKEESVLNEQKVIDRKSQLQKSIENHFASNSSQNKKKIKGVLEQIIENCLSESLEENWIPRFADSYEKLLDKQVPKELQTALESLSIESVEEIQRDKPIIGSSKEQAIREIENFFQVESKQLPIHKMHSDFILKYAADVRNGTFSKGELVLQFEKKFGVPFSEDVLQLIAQLTDENTSESQVLELEKELDGLLKQNTFSKSANPDKNRRIVLSKIIENCLSEPLEENWITRFSDSYKKLFNERVPKELQTVLESFSSELANEIQRDKPIVHLIKEKVIQEIENFFQVESKQLPIHKMHSDFILKYAADVRNGTFSKGELVLQFEKKFGVPFSEDVLQSIAQLTDENASESQVLKLEKELDGLLKQNAFSKSANSDKSRKIVLSKIIENCLNEPLEENWITRFSDSYEKLFKEQVPKKLQIGLESLSAESIKEIQRDKIVHSSKEDVIQEIENFFLANSEELPAQKAYENFILEQLKGRLLNATSKSELSVRFAENFGVPLSDEINRLLDRTIIEHGNNAKEQLQYLKTEFPRLLKKTKLKHSLRPSVTPKERNYLPSNKIKLLKLKEKLKQLQKGKKEDSDFPVSNAGMIIGWVLWKSIFTQFGWLKEGQFIRAEEIDTRELAASWLHLSVGEDPSNANPLILFMCGIELYESNPISREQLQTQLGKTDIDTSINDYYEMLLSMWPIFEPSQTGDLIELFIRREGLMKSTGLGMRLRLVKEPYDLLMDKHPIPWPISLINFSWTPSIIEVEW